MSRVLCASAMRVTLYSTVILIYLISTLSGHISTVATRILQNFGGISLAR